MDNLPPYQQVKNQLRTIQKFKQFSLENLRSASLNVDFTGCYKERVSVVYSFENIDKHPPLHTFIIEIGLLVVALFL